jgi:molecular chaperone GrpE
MPEDKQQYDSQPSNIAEDAETRDRNTTDLENQVESLESENERLKEKLLRLAAEFDNFKKRTDREFKQLQDNANAGLISQLLPVLDNLERFLQAAESDEADDSLVNGMQLVYKDFLKVLTDQGLEPIPAVGEDFDPEKHEAIMQRKVEGLDSHIVVEEHLKGYEINGRVIRHSKVIVSQ